MTRQPDGPAPPEAAATGDSPREGWEYFEVAAAVGVRAWGPDLPGCFRQCALAVFNLIVPLRAVRPAEERETAAQGETDEALLVAWINECLYLHDIEGFVASEVGAPQVAGGRLHARLLGEPVDPTRHPRGTLVKAATFHGLRVVREPGRVSVGLVLDVSSVASG